MTDDQSISQLRTLAQKASTNAYAPYSKAQIGSAVMTESGQFFSGCNVENSSFGATICAERVAILNAVSSGHRQITKLYVYSKQGWPPCGMCRQVVREFCDQNLQVIIGDEKGNEQIISIEDIFPYSFGPEHLKRQNI
ncbi:MAG: cytidine deaminase [Bacteriovoracaceae bacterium]|nr:cytidine deaminase [Bacteriovoracaceae bacterium]